MSRAALEAAKTYTVERWAGELATRARPKDYRGQLRELYEDIVRRWRYVQEHGERVPGSARAVLGQVLGASQNIGPTCPSVEACDVTRTPWRGRGWGDCDDVSTLVAAGALALGMRPRWRVIASPGHAHVSVQVSTPDGQTVDVDPVGHPEHPFG